jgi:hypothetical protein
MVLYLYNQKKCWYIELTTVYCYAKISSALTDAMLGLLQKHCPVCGMDIDKRTATKRFGKYLCSEKHAEQYAQMKMESEADREGSSGCC